MEVPSKQCRGAAAHLGGVHDLLPDVDLAEGLEEGQYGDVQPLPRPLPVAPLVEPRVTGLQQPEHARREVAVYCFLHAAHDSPGVSRLQIYSCFFIIFTVKILPHSCTSM